MDVKEIYKQNQLIISKLDALQNENLAQKKVLNMDDFCLFTGISKSWAYKLTSGRAVPYFSPNNKTIYFDREQIENWLLSNPIKTKKQLEAEVKKGGVKS